MTRIYDEVEIDRVVAPGSFEETAALSLCIESKPQWMERAACKGEPSASFFNPSGIVSKRAKVLCGSCEVRPQCLAYAVASPDLVGTWAGTSQRGRRLLRTLSTSENARKNLSA